MLPISVVMTVFNGSSYLKEAIDSVLNQSMSNFEFIILDDGSTDNSRNIIESYSDIRILKIYQENKGVSKALNHAISFCKGKYIALIDQDDVCMPNRFETQFNYLELNNNISVLSGAVIYINDSGDYLGRSFPVTYPSLISHKLFNSGCVVTHPSVMMRKNDFTSVGGYSEIIGDRFTDYHLWVKFVKKGFKIKNLSKSLIKYRINQSSISSGFFLSNSGIKVLLSIIKSEFPSSREITLLKSICKTSDENFIKRKNIYDNIPNFFFNKLSFISENLIANLFSQIRNFIVLLN